MSKNIEKKVIDVTGVELTPGEPTICLGNGEQGFECCCDECDYLLLCFPEFDTSREKEEILDEFDQLIFETVRRYGIKDELDEIDLLPDEEIKYSLRHKIRMNRLFRDEFGSSFLPFPEADNIFERTRSKIVIALNARKEKKKNHKTQKN